MFKIKVKDAIPFTVLGYEHLFIVILQYYYNLLSLMSMGASKTSYFSSKQNTSAALFKALGHPARVAIIEHLLKVNSCICNDIVLNLPLSQPTISQHLRELRDANIIKGQVEGNSICYCLNEKVIKGLKSILEGYIDILKINANCC